MTDTTLLSQPTPSTSATRVDAYTLVRFSGKDTRDFFAARLNARCDASWES